jgi:hypothetical protein
MNGATHTGTGSAVQISTLFTQEQFRQIDIKGGSGNAASAYIGPSTVTSAGANAYIELEAAATWGARAVEGERLKIDLDSLYVVAASSELVHFVVV